MLVARAGGSGGRPVLEAIGSGMNGLPQVGDRERRRKGSRKIRGLHRTALGRREGGGMVRPVRFLLQGQAGCHMKIGGKGELAGRPLVCIIPLHPHDMTHIQPPIGVPPQYLPKATERFLTASFKSCLPPEGVSDTWRTPSSVPVYGKPSAVCARHNALRALLPSKSTETESGICNWGQQGKREST